MPYNSICNHIQSDRCRFSATYSRESSAASLVFNTGHREDLDGHLGRGEIAGPLVGNIPRIILFHDR